MSVYVASSWRNARQETVVQAIRLLGLEAYDFRAPRPNDHGFHWTDVWKDIEAAEQGSRGWKDATALEFLEMLQHPIAQAGFASDMGALQTAEAVVLVLPCNRSAHLELGYAVGAGKRTAVLLDEQPEPELMYSMVDFIGTELDEILTWLRTGTR